MAFPTDPEFTNFTARLELLYQTEAVPPREKRDTFVDALGYGRWEGEYWDRRVHRGETHEQATRAIEAAIRDIWHPTDPPDPPDPPVPPPGEDVTPLKGFLRVVANSTVGDDSGPRSVRFCSDFAMLAKYRQDRDSVLRTLDGMRGRWHGVRLFWHLADPWAPDNLDVRPSWSDFDPLFTGLLKECVDRELRVSLTAGDLQYLSGPLPPYYQRIAALCASVNQQVVSLNGAVNEARVNSSQGEDWAFWGSMSSHFQHGYPWGLHGLSDPGDQEEPAALQACSRHPANVALLHGTRQDWISAIRRAFNVRYEGFKAEPIIQDEPTNMHGPAPGRIKVYQPLATKQEVFGLYSTIILTGQVLTFFGDAALTNRLPLDSDWGFTELPERWRQMHVPDDIGLYTLIPGHRPEAPITIEGIPGNAPGRCDNMVSPDGSRGYAVIYGETATTPGVWKIRARVSVAPDSGIWGPDGLMLGFNGSADVPSANQACVVEWHR